MSDKYIIAVDAMGGDHAPAEIVKGAVESLSDNNEIKIILVGQQDKIQDELNNLNFKDESGRLDIVHASEVINTDEVPTAAIKQKKDSSLVVGMKLLKEDKAQAFVSAGNTGALLTGSTVIVGRIKGIERPALATLLPTEKGFTFLIDSGANVDCKPSYLAQFGKMGSIYMEHVMGIDKPKVGLVNIGAEKEKGNALVKEAYELLENADINFIGNIEARNVPAGDADVIVCDAFVGNVILKYTEGFAQGLMSIIKQEFMSSTKSKIGAFLAKDAFRNLKKRFDYAEIGGAPFLGLKHLVVKAHGSSNAKAVKGAINQAYIFISNDIVEKIENQL